MVSTDAPDLARRPLVFVEDHLYHTAELLEAIAGVRPGLVDDIAVCALAREGPDTDAQIEQWRRQWPSLVVRDLSRCAPQSFPAAAQAIADALRPGGILVQDIQLATLPFIAPDRWWESIYLAATVRGLFPGRSPAVRLLSNKRGYAATFGRELLDAGFDPRDVMDKSDLRGSVVPAVIALFDRRFPLRLRANGPDGPAHAMPLASDEDERQSVDASFDVILWDLPDVVELGGRLIAGSESGARIRLKRGGPEAETWTRLVDDRLKSGPGLAVVEVGERIGPSDAARAELTNLAARHVHTLRGRLTDASAIVTADHAYRLAERLLVGVATRYPGP